jgi:RNA polymerase sigma-70 factor (ECF subfamily)
MSRRSIIDGKTSEPAPSDRPVRLFPGQRTHKKCANRSSDEVTSLSNDSVPDSRRIERFEQVVLPHLDSAYNLARWLTGNAHDAEDVVQGAFLKAVKFFDSFRGGDARPWLIAIVRRACCDWLERNRPHQAQALFDEDLPCDPSGDADPVELVLRKEDQELLRHALNELPIEFREVLVLRELEGLSYKEIGVVTKLPSGTIMSRLARARERLRRSLAKKLREDV